MQKTHYDILEIERGASESEIRAAFKRLAKIYHPDKNPNSADAATTSFQAINNAYDTLNDPLKRRQYDDSILRPNPYFRRPATAKRKPKPSPTPFHDDGDERGNRRERESRIKQLEQSLKELQAKKSVMDHEIWTRQQELGNIKIELDTLKAEEGKDDDIKKTEKAKVNKLTSWFKPGKSQENKEAKGLREAEKQAAIMAVQERLDEARAVINGMEEQQQVVMKQVMEQMRELAVMNI